MATDQGGQNGAAQTNGSRRTAPAGHVLVVDDSVETLDLIGALLRGAGLRVSVATGGLEALAAAGNAAPDLILLDVMMPGMDGFEACRLLKSAPRLQDVPVIFLTANADAPSVAKGFAAGAVDYVAKPFNPAELLSRVTTHLQLRAARHELRDLAQKLSRYLSPQLYASIFSGERDARIGTRSARLTVFFSDIVGFTARAGEIGEGRLAPWLNGYLDEMAQIANRHGGTLDKFIGDAVMVFFGDPQSAGAREDACRCVRMALDMRTAARSRGIDVRIGIHSGDCTVGNFGSESHMSYTIIGETVNVAARLERRSELGRLLVSDATRALIENEFLLDTRGALELRGILGDVLAWWVEGIRPPPAQDEALSSP